MTTLRIVSADADATPPLTRADAALVDVFVTASDFRRALRRLARLPRDQWPTYLTHHEDWADMAKDCRAMARLVYVLTCSIGDRELLDSPVAGATVEAAEMRAQDN